MITFIQVKMPQNSEKIKNAQIKQVERKHLCQLWVRILKKINEAAGLISVELYVFYVCESCSRDLWNMAGFGLTFITLMSLERGRSIDSAQVYSFRICIFFVSWHGWINMYITVYRFTVWEICTIHVKYPLTDRLISSDGKIIFYWNIQFCMYCYQGIATALHSWNQNYTVCEYSRVCWHRWSRIKISHYKLCQWMIHTSCLLSVSTVLYKQSKRLCLRLILPLV